VAVASAVFAGIESVRKLTSQQGTTHVGAGIATAVVGILGNQLVARYKLHPTQNAKNKAGLDHYQVRT
jgi:divalent metal cation (Fe/Co/Zn/Cd) transporter